MPDPSETIQEEQQLIAQSDPSLTLEPIEQAPTPAPTPVTGPQILIDQQEEPTPIDDETAWRYVETTGPDTAPAELEIRKREMAGYYAAKEEEDRQREAIYYEEAYTNEKKRREILDRPEVAQARIGAKDPKLVETAAINNAYLEYLIGRKLDPSELEAQRHEMGRRMFGDPSMSHDSFAAAVKGQFEHKQQERVGLTDLRANVFDDVWNNKYTTGGDTFMRWRDAHDDILNDQNEKPFYWYSRKQAETFYKAADRIKEPGSLVLDAVQTYLAGPGEDPQHEEKLNQKFVAAGEAMLALDPKDRALVWQGVKYVTDSKKVESGTVETIIDNIQKAFVERGIVGAATDVNMHSQDMQLEDTRQYLLGGDVRVRNFDGLPAAELDPRTMPRGSAQRAAAEEQTHPATPEETSDLLRKANTAMGALQMLREGKDILQTQIDPYRPVTPDIWWMRKTEMGAYNLIESAPTMVLNAVPIVGQSLMALSFASHDYNEMLLRDPSMDKRIASAGSIVSGQVQAVLEHFQIESMLGKSQLKAMLGDLRAGNFQTVARNFGILFAEQNLQEAAQDFTSMFVPWLASQFTGAEMKRQDFGVEFDKFLEQRVDVAFALLIPTLVGTGVASWTDLKNPARDLFDERMMNNAGFSPEARARILGKATLEERIAAYQEEWKKRTPEDIAAGYASTAAEIDRVNGQQTDPATPTMENRPLADGTADWHVLDAEGNTVFHSKDYDVALDQYALHAERTLSERIAAQEAAAATEEGQAATAEAEGALRLLPTEARTSASVVLDFVRNEQPRPEQSAAVARLATTLAKDPRGGPTDLVIQLPVVGRATGSGRAAYNFIQGWQQYTGKQVIFVASSSGQPLSFTGIVNSSDPNTIFLDAAGDRNVLALLGHEWAHTLALTNPQLHRAMTDAMRPLVIGWLEQEGLIKEGGYGEGQVTEELVSNIVGDAFTRPEFWTEFHRRNPSLFERIIRAIEEWFAAITAAARGTEWGTEGFISNLEEMHGIISSAIEQARQAGPEVTAPAAEAELAFAGRKHKFEERGKRETVAKGYITGKEKALIAKGVEAKLDKKGIALGPERTRLARELNRQVQADVLSHRMRYPDQGAKEPWSKSEPSGGMELEYKEAKGDEKPVVKAVARWKKQRYRFDEIPEGMTREEWARELAGKVTGQFLERIQKGLAADATKKAGEGAELILREIEWYRDFVRKLRGEFGGFSDLMADFLGAFSPRQNVRQNWRNAIDAMWALSIGKYDELFERLDTFLKAGGTMKEWRAQGGEVMTSRNGALFGVNTDRGMEAALNLWREIKAGDSPKAKNFTRNLIGLSIKATIDVWAARLLNRVAGKPRIPVGPEGAVEGEHVSEEEVKGQFAFGQEVFAHVTEMMRDPETWKDTGIDAAQFANVTPADVQAMNWFVEKEIWTEKNWTNEEGAGGSFMEEIGKIQSNRFVVGLSQQIERPGHEAFKPQNPEQARFANELLQDLRTKYLNMISLRAMDSIGMFMSDLERAIDLEMVHGADMDPNDLIRTVLYHAWSKDQQATYISRVLDPHEEDQNENARPGLEVYFKEEVPRHVLDMVVEYLTSNGINGFTLVVDQRTKPDPRGGPNKFLGVRFQYIPEFSEDGENWAKAATDINDILINAIHLLKQMPGVAYSEIMRYDTLVLLKGIDYDDSGISPGTLGKSEAVAWRRRFFDATAARANRVAEAAPEPEHGEHVPDREQGQGPRGPPEAGLSFATRRGKAAQAQVEGISREASVEAAFERMHAAPGERLGLLERIKREYTRIRAQNVATEAAAPAPQQIDPTEKLNQLEAQETKAIEDLDVEEQDALDRSSQQIADRYADRILTEQDIDARRALERESKNVAATQRKVIEKQFNERRKAIESDFRRQQQAVTSQAEQANLAATKEGAAQLSEMRRVHAFAELNALTRALPPAIRGRIGGAMTLAQARTTEASLTDFLTKRIAMIDRELERALKHAYVDRIKDLLNRFKPKRQPSGVMKSRIGGDAQDVVNRAKVYVDMPDTEVEARVSAIELQLAAGGLTPEQESALITEQNELNTFGDIEHQTSEELAAAHEALRETIHNGRAAWQISEEARLGQMRAESEEINSEIPKGTSPGIATQNRKRLRNWFNNFISSHYSFAQIIEQILPKVSFLERWQNEARRKDMADMDFVRDVTERLGQALRTAVGKNSAVAVGDALRKMDEQTISGPQGKMTKREAIQYLQAWAQEKEKQRMIDQGWKPEHIAALMRETSDPVSQALMTFFRQEYDRIWQIANPVYRRQYGMNLAQIANYAPMRYHSAGVVKENLPTGGPMAVSGVTPSAIKGRVAHNAPLRQVDALQVFLEHVHQMSHWIQFADLTREMRGVLNNADTKLALQQQLGESGFTDLTKQLDTIVRNGAARASDVSSVNEFLRYFASAKAISSLAFNPRTGAMQVDSAARWTMVVPARRWIPLLVSGKWFSAIPTAWHSPTVQRRIKEGMSPDVKYAMDAGNLSPTRLLQLVRVGMAHIRYLDAAATSLSSALVYTDAINQGFNHEQAMDIMDDAVARFSQPINITGKSQIEITSSSGIKMMMMFMSDARLKTAIMAESIANLRKGKNIEMSLQRIAMIEGMAILSQLVANLYAHATSDDDDEDMWWAKGFWHAAFLAPFQGFFFVGSIAETTLGLLLGGRPFARPGPAGEIASRGYQAYKHLDYLREGITSEKFWREIDNIMKTAGLALGPGAASVSAITNAIKPAMGAYRNIEEE